MTLSMAASCFENSLIPTLLHLASCFVRRASTQVLVGIFTVEKPAEWTRGPFQRSAARSAQVAARHVYIRHRARTASLRRSFLTLAIALDLVALAYFKYYGFLANSVANAVRPLGGHSPLPLLQVVLPIGISFFTFMAISYVVDVYRRELAPAPFLDLLLLDQPGAGCRTVLGVVTSWSSYSAV